MKTNNALLYAAWKKLIMAYLLAFAISLVAGTLLVKFGNIKPEAIFQISTKRLSYALPVFDMGARHGIDMGILLFVWNATGALVTLSFIYMAAWFDPHQLGMSPRGVRKVFCGKTKMKLFCYLPGCAKIGAESVRRLYVWLMIPMLGILLLGLESGLSVATAACIFGSLFAAIVGLLPHGLIEIPTLALSGAVTYSAHLLVSQQAQSNQTRLVFQQVNAHSTTIPIRKIALGVIGALLIAGMIEAHITPWMFNNLLY